MPSYFCSKYMSVKKIKFVISIRIPVGDDFLKIVIGVLLFRFLKPFTYGLLVHVLTEPLCVNIKNLKNVRRA